MGKSVAGFVVSLIGIILQAIFGSMFFFASHTISVFSFIPQSITLFSTIVGAVIIGEAVISLLGAILMLTNSKVKVGGVLCTIFGVLSLNLFILIGGIVAIASSKRIDSPANSIAPQTVNQPNPVVPSMQPLNKNPSNSNPTLVKYFQDNLANYREDDLIKSLTEQGYSIAEINSSLSVARGEPNQENISDKPISTTPQISLQKDSKTYALMGVLLVLIGYFVVKNSHQDDAYTMFYAKHGLVLGFAFILSIILNMILGFIPIIGTILNFVILIGVTLLWIMAIINASSGELKRLIIVSDIVDKLNL